jgi:hypothetical protein
MVIVLAEVKNGVPDIRHYPPAALPAPRPPAQLRIWQQHAAAAYTQYSL